MILISYSPHPHPPHRGLDSKEVNILLHCCSVYISFSQCFPRDSVVNESIRLWAYRPKQVKSSLFHLLDDIWPWSHQFISFFICTVRLPVAYLGFLWELNEKYMSHIAVPGMQKSLISSVAPVVSDTLQPHGLPHTKPPCPSPTPGACSNSCPSSWWCHPTISSSVVPFTSCFQSFPASGSFPMSQFFTSGSQSIEISASASILPMNIQDSFPLGEIKEC